MRSVLQGIPVADFLLVATVLEVSGDAVVRVAIYNHSGRLRVALFLVGAILLLGYGPREITVRPKGRFKADSVVALAAAVVAGLGIAKLPHCLTEAYPPEALIPVMTRFPVAPCGVYVVRPSGRHLVRKVRVLTDLLVQHLDTHLSP